MYIPQLIVYLTLYNVGALGSIEYTPKLDSIKIRPEDL